MKHLNVNNKNVKKKKKNLVKIKEITYTILFSKTGIPETILKKK